VITVAGDVLFASGQTSLKPDAKKELDKVASRLKSEFPGHSVRVEGYTDSDPIHKSPYKTNEALSLARAEAVEKYLVEQGDPVGPYFGGGDGCREAEGDQAPEPAGGDCCCGKIMEWLCGGCGVP